jgi:predicted  nucleic acid-binding Zn-ribbon protein
MTEQSYQLLELNEVDRELHDGNGNPRRTLKKRRKQIVESMDPTTFSRYETLRGRFGMAMVRLINGHCEACHMSVSSAQAQRLKLESEVMICENCGRYLYVESD